MSNINSKDGTEVPQSAEADVTTSSQTIAKPRVIGRAFVNIYEDVDCKFISDEEYGSYEAAVEGRDAIINYIETVELVRQHGV